MLTIFIGLHGVLSLKQNMLLNPISLMKQRTQINEFDFSFVIIWRVGTGVCD